MVVSGALWAPSLNWGSFSKGFRAPLEGFGVDRRQV